jgi:hypothetical protein
MAPADFYTRAPTRLRRPPSTKSSGTSSRQAQIALMRGELAPSAAWAWRPGEEELERLGSAARGGVGSRASPTGPSLEAIRSGSHWQELVTEKVGDNTRWRLAADIFSSVLPTRGRRVCTPVRWRNQDRWSKIQHCFYFLMTHVYQLTVSVVIKYL